MTIKPTRIKLTIMTLFWAILSTQTVWAAQFIDASDGAEISAIVSLNELNRIRIEGSKIDGIRIAKGAIEYSRDEKSGDVFLNLTSRSRRPINIFLTSSTGSTFKLLLMPKDVPSEQIFLVERVVKNGIQIFDNYQDSITDFYKLIEQGNIPKDYKVSSPRVVFNFAKNIADCTVTLRTSYLPTKNIDHKFGFKAEIFEVKNISSKVKNLNPEDFYLPGVRAIKFTSLILQPSEASKMVVISIAG